MLACQPKRTSRAGGKRRYTFGSRNCYHGALTSTMKSVPLGAVTTRKVWRRLLNTATPLPPPSAWRTCGRSARERHGEHCVCQQAVHAWRTLPGSMGSGPGLH